MLRFFLPQASQIQEKAMPRRARDHSCCSQLQRDQDEPPIRAWACHTGGIAFGIQLVNSSPPAGLLNKMHYCLARYI